jgi:hypothetical protein
MESFQEFLRTFGPQHFAAALPVTLVINTLAMWFVANYMQDLGDKVSLLRAFVCAVLLYVVSSIAIFLLMFPVPLVLVGAVVFWLVGSILVIRGVFELMEGGIGTLFTYILILTGIHLLSHLPVHFAILRILQ